MQHNNWQNAERRLIDLMRQHGRRGTTVDYVRGEAWLMDGNRRVVNITALAHALT
jgi:hypothetical protein